MVSIDIDILVLILGGLQMRRVIFLMFVLLFAVTVVSCGDDPVPNVPVDNDIANTASDNDTANTGNDPGNTGNDSGNTGDTGDDGDTADTGDTACDTKSLGTNCTLDGDCGACNICVGGKCSKGCTTDDDCQMYKGLKCNKKLYRCTNIYASSQACGETKCPSGCCYAEAGFTALKCIANPTSSDAAKCGLCSNGDIYMPDASECVPAVCSVTTDPCPTFNKSSTDPKPECFECKSGEFICAEDTTCSSGVLVNAAQCIPAGQKCVAGVSECCSGMPCVEGYCY